MVRRLIMRKSSMVSVAILALMLLISVGSLPFSVRWFNVQALTEAIRHAPSWQPVVHREAYVGGQGASSKDVRSSWLDQTAYEMSSLLGHDDLGRSLLFRLLPGFLVSLAIGLGAALVAIIVGTTWGAIAALAGGRVDMLMMRVVDVLFGLPYILMVILLKVALFPMLVPLLGDRVANLAVLFVAIGGVSWLTMARVIRGQVLSLKTQIFVDAARTAGAGKFHILRRHIVPNLIGPILTYGALVVPQAVMQESFLSFLGIGVQQPVPSLGRLAADGVDAVNTFVAYWWLIVFPCAALVVTLISMNFIGDALRDVFDPKSKDALMT